MILGYPQKSFWKHMYPSWDYQMIESAPRTVLLVLGGNILLVMLIYLGANSGLLRSVRPIVDGIRRLPEGEPVRLKEKGILSELAFHLNKASEVLQSQKYQLMKLQKCPFYYIVLKLELLSRHVQALHMDSQMQLKLNRLLEHYFLQPIR